MNKRAIIGYWLLILLPMALISGYAWKMLAETAERLEATARETVHQHLGAIAESIQLTVSGVQDELMLALGQLPPSDPLPALRGWVDENPLVRNVFVWRPPDILDYPPPLPTATAEEQRFRLRYQALFSGRIAWSTRARDPRPLPDPVASRAAPGTYADRPAASLPSPPAPSLASERQKAIRLARTSRLTKPSALLPSPLHESGWIPWFAENQLHLLGWFQAEPGGAVRGVELELIALLSRLIPDLSADFVEQGILALMDDQDRIWHQVGQGDPATLPSPALSVSLSPALPHWQIAWYADTSGLAPGAGAPQLQLLGGIMLAAFAGAVILGTLLLTQHARRHWRDARRKTTFVSNVSHELKTPLTTIRMYAELLESRRIRDADKQNRYLQIIANESRRLSRLVDNVLDFARLEQNRKHYRLGSLDLVPFLEEFIAGQSIRLKADGFALHLHPYPRNGSPEPPASEGVRVTADPDALKQICLNLLDNGLKYAAAGHKMDILLEAKGPSILICFRDYGPGIPPAQRARIFRKFHRLDTSLTTRNPGSGLGLSIARGLARGMGGDLTYRPGSGGGSCFCLSLPREPRLASKRELQAPSAESPNRESARNAHAAEEKN